MMKDGGPAFPQGKDTNGAEGMSLRDWFAGMVLAGSLSDVSKSRLVIAENAYDIADAMLRNRNRNTEQEDTENV